MIDVHLSYIFCSEPEPGDPNRRRSLRKRLAASSGLLILLTGCVTSQPDLAQAEAAPTAIVAEPQPTAALPPAADPTTTATAVPTVATTPQPTTPQPTPPQPIAPPATAAPLATATPVATPVVEDPAGDSGLCVSDIVAPDTLNLRSGPSIDAPITTDLVADTCGIQALGPADNGWRPIQVYSFGDGSLMAGYASNRHLAPNPQAGFGLGFNPNLIDPDWCVEPAATPARLFIAPDDTSLVLAELIGPTCGIYPASEVVDGNEWVRVSYERESLGGWMLVDLLATSEQFIDFGDEPPRTVRFALPETSTAPLSNFKAYTQDGQVVGTLDQNGQLEMPNWLGPIGLRFTGWHGDKYCQTQGISGQPIDGVFPIQLGGTLCT